MVTANEYFVRNTHWLPQTLITESGSLASLHETLGMRPSNARARSEKKKLYKHLVSPS